MIPGMPSLGGLEVLILLAIVLLFFGAKRIPDLARSLGKGTREFRKGISEGAAEDDDRARDHSEEERREQPSAEEGAATRGEVTRTAEKEAETPTQAEQKA